MITFEESKRRFMNENGQLLIPFASLKLTDDVMEQIFVQTARKLQNKRPPRALLSSIVDPTGIYIPDCIGVLALKYKIYDNFDRISAPISREYYWFDPSTRILRTLFSSPFIITYLQEYQVGYFPQSDNVMTTIDGEDTVSFYLNTGFKSNSLTLTKSNTNLGTSTTSTVTSVNGNIATLGGTLGTGTINLDTLYVTLNMIDTSACDIIATYTNSRKAIKNIDLQNMPFYLWLTVDWLRAWASLKYQATMNENTGLPFSLQADTLLERARVLEDQLQAQLNNNSNWYMWGF